MPPLSSILPEVHYHHLKKLLFQEQGNREENINVYQTKMCGDLFTYLVVMCNLPNTTVAQFFNPFCGVDTKVGHNLH